MAEVIGTPRNVQERRTTVSATIDVETGLTDFIYKKTLVDVDTNEVVSSVTVRETQPTGDASDWLNKTITASASVEQHSPNAD